MPCALQGGAAVLLVLAGGSVPNFSAERYCRGIAELLREPEYLQVCMGREREARDQLKAS